MTDIPAKRKDYKKLNEEWNELQLKQNRLEQEIKNRLLWLATNNPEAIIGKIISNAEHIPIKAKSIADEKYIKYYNVENCLSRIKIIEEWIENQQPYIQTIIDFPVNAIHIIPEKPVGERVIISAGKAYSRKPQ